MGLLAAGEKRAMLMSFWRFDNHMHNMAVNLSLAQKADRGVSDLAGCRGRSSPRQCLALLYCFCDWVFEHFFILRFFILFLLEIPLRSACFFSVTYVVSHTVRKMVLETATVADSHTIRTERVRTA